jgi:hypothetical protein
MGRVYQGNTLDSRVRGNDAFMRRGSVVFEPGFTRCGHDYPMVRTAYLCSRGHNTLSGRMHDTVEFTGGDVSQQMGLVL